MHKTIAGRDGDKVLTMKSQFRCIMASMSIQKFMVMCLQVDPCDALMTFPPSHPLPAAPQIEVLLFGDGSVAQFSEPNFQGAYNEIFSSKYNAVPFGIKGVPLQA